MTPHEWLMTFRPISQMIKIWVLRDLDCRLADGRVKDTELPLQVDKLRFLQVPGGKAKVELNEEVRITAMARAKRAIRVGEPLSLEDIDADDVLLEAPLIDGRRAAFFLVVTNFLNIFTIFDFTPNDPGSLNRGAEQEAPESLPLRYPARDVARWVALLDMMRPVEQFRRLAQANWPPTPAYYPNVVHWAYQNPGRLTEAEFADVVASACEKK